MAKVVIDAGHIFNHYLEKNIPPEEWQRMQVEDAMAITKDTEALFEGTMSPSEYSKKWRLPRG